MMMNATEMRAAADKAVAARIANEKNRAMTFCDTVVMEAIEHVANSGGYATIVSVDNGISLDFVAEYLTNNGYKVEFNMGTTMRVKW